MVPLHGHSRGYCSVTVYQNNDWFFNAADAGAVYNNETAAWLIKLVLGLHDRRLRMFMNTHPEVFLVNSHLELNYIKKVQGHIFDAPRRGY